MADTEFEELRHSSEMMDHHKHPTVPFYSLVPGVFGDDSPTSSKSDPDLDCDSSDAKTLPNGSKQDENVDNQRSAPYLGTISAWGGQGKRRKLPEIPKNKKTSLFGMHQHQSLADELGSAGHPSSGAPSASAFLVFRSCGQFRDEESSPDSERLPTDADSGHSTAHSPKSMSPTFGLSSLSISDVGGGLPYPEAEMLDATHRGLHKFVPRHADEIDVEIGDPIYVQKEGDDLWCEGVNLRTGRIGIFPSAYAVDCDYNEWSTEGERGRRERFRLGYLGSVETTAHKGTSVVCQAVRRVVANAVANAAAGKPIRAHACILEVTDQGLRMVDKAQKNKETPCIDYFYTLKNVSFCAFHPRDHRYLGFITKHPAKQRFACHVFMGTESTRPVAESVGRAFHRFYQKFVETAYPVEDIYIE